MEYMSLDYILSYLLNEQTGCIKPEIPDNREGKRLLMRALLNVRPDKKPSKEFLKAQDAELQRQLHEKGIVELDGIQESVADRRIKLWQGDITRLKADAIVNAANSQMLGCFVPLHGCIDNAIHSAAGIQLRIACSELMKMQGYPEPTGSAKITPGYNLPSKYVIHTVGPIIGCNGVSPKEENELADCYDSCLKIAEENNLKSIAFCCISTGEYRFPNGPAAAIAIKSVRTFLNRQTAPGLETVVFNVFRDVDYKIYRSLLSQTWNG